MCNLDLFVVFTLPWRLLVSCLELNIVYNRFYCAGRGAILGAVVAVLGAVVAVPKAILTLF